MNLNNIFNIFDFNTNNNSLLFNSNTKNLSFYQNPNNPINSKNRTNFESNAHLNSHCINAATMNENQFKCKLEAVDVGLNTSATSLSTEDDRSLVNFNKELLHMLTNKLMFSNTTSEKAGVPNHIHFETNNFTKKNENKSKKSSLFQDNLK